MIQNLTFGNEQKFRAAINFVACGVAGLVIQRDAAEAKTTGISPAVSRMSPAGRSISTGRDLLRSQFPLGWSSR